MFSELSIPDKFLKPNLIRSSISFPSAHPISKIFDFYFISKKVYNFKISYFRGWKSV